MPDSLYKRLLGPAYDRLPAALRDMHDFRDKQVANGVCEVQRGRNPIARFLAAFFRFPDEGSNIPIRVTFEAGFGRETWTRDFGGQRLQTVQWIGRSDDEPMVVERFGPAAITLSAIADDDSVRFEPRRLTLLGIPLPRFLFPRIEALESVQGGLFSFDVRADLPVLGLLIRYTGYLIPRVNAMEVAPTKRHEGDPVMLFDGVCNLCCASVQFFLARDRQGLIRYCPMQSLKGQEMLRDLDLPLSGFKSFAVRDGETLYLRSDAYFHLLRFLPLPWRLVGIGRSLPRGFRDGLYDHIAAARYRVFGRRNACMVPTPEQRERFV